MLPAVLATAESTAPTIVAILVASVIGAIGPVILAASAAPAIAEDIASAVFAMIMASSAIIDINANAFAAALACSFCSP